MTNPNRARPNVAVSRIRLHKQLLQDAFAAAAQAEREPDRTKRDNLLKTATQKYYLAHQLWQPQEVRS